MSEVIPNDFQITKIGDEQYTIYVARRTDHPDFSISTSLPDSFVVNWPTVLTTNEFLETACQLVNAVGELRPLPRPIETAPEITEIAIAPDHEGKMSGRVSLPGSYSGFSYNNLMVNGKGGFAELPFERLNWPITREGINEAILTQTNGDKFRVSEKHFIRINSEFCSILFNGSTADFTYWSHVPAIEALTKTYAETTAYPGVEQQFQDAVNLIASPRFAKFLRENEEKIPLTPEEQWAQILNLHYQKVSRKPEYTNASEEAKRARALGEAYNNFIIRIPLINGEKRFGVNSTQVDQIAQIMKDMQIDNEELYGQLDKITEGRSPDNPAFIEFDRLARPILLEMMKRHGYTLLELIS